MESVNERGNPCCFSFSPVELLNLLLLAWPKCAKVNVVVRWADDGYYDDDADVGGFSFSTPPFIENGGGTGKESNQILFPYEKSCYLLLIQIHILGGVTLARK